jgi:two-component system, cell cycle sensor histidine kinase and response regulator CckA
VSIANGAVVSYFKASIDRFTRGPARSLNVLIVDDEAPIRHFVERVVRQAGHTTTTAADGVEALAVAATLEGLDLLVTDLMMPNMNGDELARRLVAARPTLKVLYLTGFSDRLFTEKVALWQDEAFLDKPCSVKGLMEAVSLLLVGRLETPQPAQ